MRLVVKLVRKRAREMNGEMHFCTRVLLFSTTDYVGTGQNALEEKQLSGIIRDRYHLSDYLISRHLGAGFTVKFDRQPVCACSWSVQSTHSR